MQVPKSITVAEIIKSSSIFLIGVASLLGVLLIRDLFEQRERQDKDQECQFDINAEVSEIDDKIDLKISEILIAAVREEDARIPALGDELEELTGQLAEASDRRANAVEICNARNS